MDTNEVINLNLSLTGDVMVHLAGGKIIVIDREEYEKLYKAMEDFR